MGDPKGFMSLRRAAAVRQPVETRRGHWREFYLPLAPATMQDEGARCMDCGTPFCHGDTGCPLGNLIPEWNDLVYRGRWREASDVLHATNNFPEFTGRLCPAPCESACVLGLIEEPVAIRQVEQGIADRAFADRWVVPRPPLHDTGRSVAVVGSGPAGLAAAQQLRRVGHVVTVFEKADRLGGLLRYGIPEFKMEKALLDRRLDQLADEGIAFNTGVHVGADLDAETLRREFDAVLLATGAQQPRELDVPGRELHGVHFAMEFLTQQNRRLAGDRIHASEEITARGKHVVIIGGGDTGSDCAGTCVRQGAVSVRQFELLPQPPLDRHPSTPWPLWPMKLRTSHAHEEGCEREWSVATTALTGADGRVQAVHAVRVEKRAGEGGRPQVATVAGTEFVMQAQLVLLAMGFDGPTDASLLTSLAVHRDSRGMVATDDGHRTNVEGVFAAGDVRRGASLIVWAIREGRTAAAAVHAYLTVPTSAASSSRA